MTLAEINARVADVEACSGDDERAHALEDDLWRAVLSEIASGRGDVARKARAALKTLDVKFSRRCA